MLGFCLNMLLFTFSLWLTTIQALNTGTHLSNLSQTPAARFWPESSGLEKQTVPKPVTPENANATTKFPNSFNVDSSDEDIIQSLVGVWGNSHVPILKPKKEGAFCRRSFDRHSGYCILAYQCLHVIREYRLYGTRIDTCTYRKSIPVICCPLAEKQDQAQRISAQKCEEYNVAVNGIPISNVRTFSGKLCVPSMPMIVGGQTTRTGEYAHMGALGWTQDTHQIKWGCGGALISERFVLTAAHCATTSNISPDLVRLGAQNLNESSTTTEDFNILMIILHPKYRSSAYYHDIALLKLSTRVRFKQSMRPACLWQLSDINIRSVTATGWGRTEFRGHTSDSLQKVDLDLIEQKLCKDVYHKERRLPRGIIDEQFCAGNLDGGKDTCQGDSGGPVHAELPEFNCVKFIVGITSFGKFCAASDTPGVYTKIYPYLGWIEKIVFK